MRKHIFITILCAVCLSFLYNSGSIAQNKEKATNRVEKLERTVKKLSDRVTLLEAIVSGLGKKQSGSIEEMHYHFVISTRDMIIGELVNIAASAYQFRIRPTTMGGGGGSYIGYTTPKYFRSKEYATYTVSVSKDTIVLLGTSTAGMGTVTATLEESGKTENFIFTGEFE